MWSVKTDVASQDLIASRCLLLHPNCYSRRARDFHNFSDICKFFIDASHTLVHLKWHQTSMLSHLNCSVDVFLWDMVKPDGIVWLNAMVPGWNTWTCGIQKIDWMNLMFYSAFKLCDSIRKVLPKLKFFLLGITDFFFFNFFLDLKSMGQSNICNIKKLCWRL